ncbi:oligopeptide ABC transporter substrate-binding protein [Priestia taiwanensis]|uniref:ABC transporter substrate-binding protein n=1 Tax=Priestia taiwanensis TaxID=1347902 RepID=A0A917AJP5_9BACI|nr:oligopeptide ABC transporter substrate-binding protein [Priestia taiwanensis]MBM7361774.1 peptide/nickel transport system substrate-binding protein [Priestia taiwanensis]GGE56896.1 ABC transporter substrate-binding protein [Priestia taiwanensis]
MELKKISKVLSAVAISTLLLSACGGGGETKPASKPAEGGDKAQEQGSAPFPSVVKNDKEAVKDGKLTYGIVSGGPLEGIFHPNFYGISTDAEAMDWFYPGLLSADDNFQYTNDGAAEYEISQDRKTITLKIKDKVKWHDGKDVTADDLLYSYEVIAHPDYKGVRFAGINRKIVGIEKYHKGETDKIEGIKITDPKTISITFTEPDPGIVSGIWDYPMHREYFKGVSIDKMAESKQVREKPIGFGPFKVEKIVPGEALSLVRVDDYFLGTPQLKQVELKVIAPAVAAASLKNGEVDIAMLTEDQYEQSKESKNLQLIGRSALSYNYIGFKLGKYDTAKKTSVMDPNAKMADKNLRQAMAYAIDKKSIAEKLYKGLRIPATSVIPPAGKPYHDKTLKGYEFDVEKAKKLLDDAGYKDTTGDNIREKDGKEFKITFAARNNNALAEAYAKFLLQSWEKVGLKVEFLDGKLHESSKFYDMVEADNPAIDVFAAGWNTGSDPDPSGIWAKEVGFNFPRWVNAKNDELLTKGTSPEAADTKFRIDVYNEWQKLIHDEAPLVPIDYRYDIYGVNTRVKNFDKTYGTKVGYHDIAVTEKEPVK